MSWPLFLHLVRHAWRGPLRVTVVVALVTFELVTQAVEASSDLPPDTALTYLALALASGVVGTDLSSGRLALVLARPLERWRYVVTSWAAAGATAACVLLVGLALSLVVAATFGIGDLPTPEDVAVVASQRILFALGVAAVLTALGTVAPSHGGSGVWLALLVLIEGAIEAGKALHSAFLIDLGVVVGAMVIPRVDLRAAFMGDAVAWTHVLGIPSIIAGSLMVATLVLVRREPRSAVTVS